MSGVTFELDLAAWCIRCGAERELDGKLIAEGQRTMVVQAPTPCECGERRFKVGIGIDDAEDEAGPQDEGGPPDRDAG